MEKRYKSLVIGFCRCANCGWTEFNWHTYFKCPNCGGTKYVKEKDPFYDLEPEEEAEPEQRSALGVADYVDGNRVRVHM